MYVFSGSRRIEQDEPTECLRCGLTPERAYFSKQPPAVITHPGWIRCSCSGPQPYSVTEELLRQQEAADGLKEEAREIRDCFYESTRRRVPSGGSGNNGGGRDNRPCRREVRHEQEWMGFAEADKTEIQTIEKFTVLLKGKIPSVLRKRLKDEAKKLGRHREGHLFRWLLSRHLAGLEDAREVEYGSNTTMLEVLVTKQWATLWKAKKAELSESHGRPISNADMMTEILTKEWR